MQAPENRATGQGEEARGTAAGEAFGSSARAEAPEEWRHSFWDSLLSFWGAGEPQQRLESETLLPEGRLDTQHGWWIEEWDFSAEHGYEPEFEGRSEFEHGEFDRWL